METGSKYQCSHSSAILLSSLLASGILGFGDGVSAITIFSDSSTGQLSLGLLISTGAGLINIRHILSYSRTDVLFNTTLCTVQLSLSYLNNFV